ncbi:molybdopterin-dependent oxidoreductase [Simiduia sp. 21SJ11W-1]|uniref:xanthine dehydrogenase family protein molybdopterin-binding subunit n=1 Tax=Simiduia sp. 21SJ11W-1 TaxID=2909669 RepID=UPI0020A0D473|nr:molybdopterin cofactor-binding domain-containing protein [Simiduia sp. 21SJ11W-1]UTA46775.1 molybdopterin-dependent oxidoreductase [Simiduia sp. 21SJ11W-1]
MSNLQVVNRRAFLKLTGLAATGLALQASLPANAAWTGQQGGQLSLNVFVHLDTDGTVTLVAHRSEMGQGIRTSLPQIIADEMEADWSKVKIVQALGDKQYGNQNTDGSRSVVGFYQIMREMGAAAKAMLCQAGANHWQVPVESCTAENHQVHHRASGRSLPFGELAAAAAKLPAPGPKTLQFKDPSNYKYIGKGVPMVDLDDIVRGTTEYGVDVQLPDMVHASIERCPYLGGTLKSVDDKAARKVPGVVDIIRLEGGQEPPMFHPLAGVAVLATNTWAAQQARKKLVIEWQPSPHQQFNSNAELTALGEALPGEPKQVRVRGDVKKALAESAQRIQAVYSVPHLEHATMEPPAAAARMTENGCEVWACVQAPQRTQQVVAGAVGVAPEQVKVHVTLLGSAFGRKSKPDFAAEAAYLAKACGRPVKVIWSREDAVRHGYYHAFSVQHFSGGVDGAGKLVALKAAVASPTIMSTFQPEQALLQDFEVGQGFANMPYEVPHQLAQVHPTPAHTRIGWLRSVYNINHAFSVNSFIDEVAHLVKRDPLEYQLQALGADRTVDTREEGFAAGFNADYPYSIARMKNVLARVKASAKWPAKTGAGEGWGVAVHHSFLSYVAVASKVKLEGDSVRVTDVHIALDCGQIVNPDRVHAQMEGAVIFGLSLALMGEISFKNGRVEQSNFDDYPLCRIGQSPNIVVTLIESAEKHGGVGEPGVPPVAPSVTNAIAAAGGPRIRSLPVARHLRIA